MAFTAAHHIPLDIDPQPPKRSKTSDWLSQEHDYTKESDASSVTSTSQQDEDENAQDSSRNKRRRTLSASQSPSTVSVVAVEKEQTEQTLHSSVETRLEKLVLPMTTEIDTASLARMRSGFYTRIQRLQMRVYKDNKLIDTSFSPDEVVEITNFFFSDMLGPKALRRLSELVHYYSGGWDDVVDKGLASRARRLAEDSKTPEMLRRFYGQLSRAAESDTDENRVFKQVQQVLQSLDFMKEYKQLKLKAQQKDPGLVKILKQQGQTTRKGVTLVTCLINALSSSLVVSKVTLTNIVQSLTGIERLVESFGEGLILLLPPAAGHRLTRWGNQRMAYVYPILREELSGLQQVCEYISIQVLDRIRRGEPIPLGQVKTGTKLSLQERIQEAVEEKGGVSG